MPSPSSPPAPSSSSIHPDNYTISHQASMDRVQRGESSASGSDHNGAISLQSYTREEARDAIVASLVQILEQPVAMLREGKVTDEQMRAESRLIPGSSLGKHLRHVHDHFRILLDSLESHAQTDEMAMDYDKRMRVVPLETSVSDAVDEFQRTQSRIQSLLGGQAAAWQTDLDRHVRLTATTPAEVDLGSTLGREMWFVCLHSIHHFALARVILVHELGIPIDNSFGVAPSTMVLRLWRQASERQAKL